MPRRARIVLQGHPHHVVQRAHRRQPIFTDEADCLPYLNDLQRERRRLQVAVYAWCLMPNHVHLLLAPLHDCRALPQIMGKLAGGAGRRFNHRHGLSGTLWESRYYSSVIETEEYFWECCRYIELNPVRAGIVDRPEQYPWSSYRARMLDQGGVDAPPGYDATSPHGQFDLAAYARFVQEGM